MSKHHSYGGSAGHLYMVRISTIVFVLAIILGIGLIPIPIPGTGIVAGISGIILGIILRVLGY